MLKTISATKARINFGEVMKQAKSAPVIVERGGKAEVVVMSKKAYDQLIAAKSSASLQKRLDEIHIKIRAELVGRALNIADIIQQGRDDRDEQILNSLR
jgi:prevent-host-death family protein